MRGGLFVISGPSGVGKGTLRAKLFELVPDLAYSISCTTRQPREGERDGVDYRFVTEEQFDALLEQHAFLEWAQVHNHRYGTLKRDVDALRDAGKSVILEIDVQGASQVRHREPTAKTVFVAPPSLEALEERLRGRGTEDEGELRCRLHNAQGELDQQRAFDRVIINREVNRAAEELAAFIEEAGQ